MFQGASNFGKLHLIPPQQGSRISTPGVYSGNNALFWGHRNTENDSITAPRVTLGYTGMEYWKVKNVVNMDYMFKDCTSLDTHTFLDGRPWSSGYLNNSTRYEDFTLASLESAKEMFSGCTSLNQDLTYANWGKYSKIERLKRHGIIVELEGGSGGKGQSRNNAGKGTFVRAHIDYTSITTDNSNNKLYIHIGRKGRTRGGGNGGGDGGYHSIKQRSAGGGGGASFISLVPGTLANIESNDEMNNVLVIAGGGGGGGSGTLVDYGLTAEGVDGYGGSNSNGFKGGGNNGEYGDPGIIGNQPTTAGQDAQVITTYVQGYATG